ncbi:MAG: CDP-alcohol phosphatidyltransferase family protein [Proteobacteria bacterium]|nr:CDP-alcohol phosphatidyltransferase family protein [Pseudomonadota bacterium]
MVTPADMLTILRLVLTPVFLALFAAGLHGWAIACFSVAGATDLVDGTVARLTGRPSKLGALLDPLADKALIQTCFISLAVVGILPLWFVLLALARDAMIISGIAYLTRSKVEIPIRALIISKIATFCMLLVAVTGLVIRMSPAAVFIGRPLQLWLIWGIVITAALLLISGVKYLMIGFDILRNRSIREERFR